VSGHKDTRKRWTILLFIAVGLVLGSVLLNFLSTRRQPQPQDPFRDIANPEATVTLRGLNYTSIQEGEAQWRLEAVSVDYLEAKRLAIFKSPTIHFDTVDQGTVTIIGDKAILQMDSNDLEIRGRIVIKNGQYELATEQVTYLHQQKEFIANSPVRLSGKGMDLQADAMRYHIHANRTFLTGNVRGRMGGNVEL